MGQSLKICKRTFFQSVADSLAISSLTFKEAPLRDDPFAKFEIGTTLNSCNFSKWVRRA